MIQRDTIASAICRPCLAATKLPPDVEAALEAAVEAEADPLARRHLLVSLENARAAEGGEGLVCADTGFPLFFITAGSRTQIEGGFGALHQAAAEATARATADSFLRPTMVDPLTRRNPGDNVGPGCRASGCASGARVMALRSSPPPRGAGVRSSAPSTA